ncbi:MAG: PLP-dependent transferase [Desulfatiglandaceae bacterium]
MPYLYVEVRVTRPATKPHSGISPQGREEMGFSAGLIRVSVGIEATEDLIEDFAHAWKG